MNIFTVVKLKFNFFLFSNKLNDVNVMSWFCQDNDDKEKSSSLYKSKNHLKFEKDWKTEKNIGGNTWNQRFELWFF